MTASSNHRRRADPAAHTTPVGRPFLRPVRRMLSHRNTQHAPHQRSTLQCTTLHAGADDATADDNHRSMGVRCAGRRTQMARPSRRPARRRALGQSDRRRRFDRTIRFIQSAHARGGPGARERAFHSALRHRTGCGAHCCPPLRPPKVHSGNQSAGGALTAPFALRSLMRCR